MAFTDTSWADLTKRTSTLPGPAASTLDDQPLLGTAETKLMMEPLQATFTPHRSSCRSHQAAWGP